MRLNDVRIYYKVSVPVPASAVPDIIIIGPCFVASVCSQGASRKPTVQCLPAMETSMARSTQGLGAPAAVHGTCLPRQMPSCVRPLVSLYPCGFTSCGGRHIFFLLGHSLRGFAKLKKSLKNWREPTSPNIPISLFVHP